MNLRIICLLLPVFLLSCSKKSLESERRAAIQPLPGLPFQITVVKTSEAKEQAEIRYQAATLLNNRDYDNLEDLFANYRDSKQCYADGTWKLMIAYDAIASADELSTSGWESHQKEIQEWIQARPQSITARTLMARFLRNYAWAVRGSGWGRTVSDAQWKLFGDRLNQAWNVLDDAGKLKEKCPVYWSTKMGVALGLQLDKSQFKDIFQRAIAAEPDYVYYYTTRAVYLLPRWYGEEGEWEKDLTHSADSLGGEKGDLLYAQVVWNIHHYGENIDVFEKNTISWERVDRGFAAILNRFPDSLAAKNERAHLAGLAGDREKARKYFIQTEGNVDLSVWHAKGEFIEGVNWAFANEK